MMAPLSVQGRNVGRIVTELDVGDPVAQRRNAALALLAGNAVATLVLVLAGYFVMAATRRRSNSVVSRSPRKLVCFMSRRLAASGPCQENRFYLTQNSNIVKNGQKQRGVLR
ncbi:hypothetical protein GE300_21385 [Rhodobacteraceae bacterium 2CG4]|uniref:Uncharacterized protein n=1 Tax=Halovulum marinum TaxID=2662447 RepID=A0A6L5Z7G6_9RHOB|nr:hypothetical protein [Halovulum marinum]MSU92100.1 hypothetical protein [Halovulum marinum]